MTENDLLLDCLERLNSSGVPYMLTGSMASNYWGIPRTTHDLDFVVQMRAEHVPRMVAAFAGEFFIQESSVRGALTPPYQFNALDNRSALKVDFWVLTDDAFAQEMFNRRQSIPLFGKAASIATPEDLVLHKLHWHKLMPSERQLLDVAGIWALQEQNLDLDYLKKWATLLSVTDDLGRIQRGEVRPKNT